MPVRLKTSKTLRWQTSYVSFVLTKCHSQRGQTDESSRDVPLQQLVSCWKDMFRKFRQKITDDGHVYWTTNVSIEFAMKYLRRNIRRHKIEFIHFHRTILLLCRGQTGCIVNKSRDFACFTSTNITLNRKKTNLRFRYDWKQRKENVTFLHSHRIPQVCIAKIRLVGYQPSTNCS